ncbi:MULTISPECIES: DUF2690 domain-containing protein [Streptomyces]|uniref:DUF2690 domain-containing protein n=1 Tax=Streptomyces TaxID=1883 RepID=UPI00224883B1|nr:DUF2690 domain-containing protein [Streptomyces sp. JHD 1]MCX2969766.1 DUF2690 domain-containing protein [Streptomyces sp. JHD 1]
MTEWKPLPDGLEPDVERFFQELRAQKDATGLSLAGLAEVTAYSKSSWDRCLNGCQLPPEAAVRALARRAGGDVERVAVLWELADHAVSGRGRTTAPADPPAGPAAAPAPAAPDVNPPSALAPDGAAPDADTPEPATPAPAAPAASPAPAARPQAPPPRRATRTGVLAGLAAVALTGAVVLGVFAGRDEPAAPGGSGGHPAAGDPVQGQVVQCHGGTCEGLDSVAQGCGGDAWTAATSRVGSSYVEVRYSSACRAAWARIRWAQPGDRVEVVTEDGRRHVETVPDDANLAAYTVMVGAPTPGEVRACWLAADGGEGCTEPGGGAPLPEAPPVPS